MNETREVPTPDDVVDYVGETFAERGRRYFDEGRIAAATESDGRLTAKCYGSKEEPYDVSVQVDGDSIRQSRCSCPVPRPCKHVAALLFAYIEHPAAFQHPARLRRRLEKLPQPMLVELLMNVAQEDVHVERALEERVLQLDEPIAVDSEEIRTLAEGAFDAGFERASGSGLSGAIPGIIEELERIEAIAERRLEVDDTRDALEVWLSLAEVVLTHDRHGILTSEKLADWLESVESHIAHLLPELEDHDLKSRALECLWSLYAANLEHGGIGLGVSLRTVLQRHGTPEEIERFVDRALEQIESLSGDDDGARFRVLQLSKLLEQFDPVRARDERVIDRLNRLEAGTEIVSIFVEADCIEEAKQRALDIEYAYDFTDALELFVEAGHADIAEDLADERMESGRHHHAIETWLIDYYDEHERSSDALDLSLRMLREHPSRKNFARVLARAKKSDRGDEVEAEARAILRESAPRELLRLYLENGELDEAVDLWGEIASDWSPHSWQSSDVELEFASAVADDHPDIAAGIFTAEARTLVEQGGADNYRRAVDLLDRARQSLLAHEKEGRWNDITRQFRDDYGPRGDFIDQLETVAQ